MAEQQVIELHFEKGMARSGHVSTIPDGYARLVQNLVYRPNRVEIRPPFSDDGLPAAVYGLANWNDLANQQERLVAITNTGGPPNPTISVKSTTTESYAGTFQPSSAIGTGYVPDHANYRGVLYLTDAFTVSYNSVPSATMGSFDGTTFKPNPLGGETLGSLTVTSFIDRLFLGYVRSSVTNQLGTTTAYDSTSWISTSATTENLVSSTSTISRVTPTATTGSKIEKGGVYTIAASASDTNLVWRSDLRNTSPTFEMPMTIEIFIKQVWAATTAYVAGTLRAPTTGNGFRYRVQSITTGISAGVEPAWPTTVGTPIVDGGVTWVCDGKDALASQPLALSPASLAGTWSTFWCQASVPPMPAATNVAVRIKFGTEARPTYDLAPVDISLKDGVADGVLTKRNYGQQLTVGKFFYPFFNQQSSATATIDLDNDIYWTETSDPNTIEGNNYYRLQDLPGKVTGATTVGGYYVVFKRRGMWVFQGQADPENPIRLVRFYSEFGCIGPRALTVFEDTLYFVGENEIYSFRFGGQPQPLCGDAMREEIMAKGSSWVESQAGTAIAAVASIGIDQQNRDLLVNTQFRTVYCLHLDSGAWSKFVPGTLGASAQAYGLFTWNQTKGHLYCATSDNTGGVVRYNIGSNGQDESPDAKSAFPQIYLTFRPLESIFPAHEITLEDVTLYHTTTNASGTLKVEVSLDGSATWTKYSAVTLRNSATTTVGIRDTIMLRQSGQNLAVRLNLSGANAGGSQFAVSRVTATIRVLGPKRNLSNPTQLGSSL